MTVFIAAKGAPILERVREAAAGRGDAELAEALVKRFSGRSRQSYYRAYRLLRKAPSFAELRYGGRTLGTHLFPPPDTGLLVLENPYNGGRLAPQELTLVEHLRDDVEGRLDAVALRRAPKLSALELTVLEQVPEDQLEMNLSMRANCCDSVTDFAQVVIAVTFAMLCMSADPVEEIDPLDEERIRKLGPAASARVLLEIRREALGHTH